MGDHTRQLTAREVIYHELIATKGTRSQIVKINTV